MEQNYTVNEIVKFIYRDMQAVDYCELLFAMDNQPELNESYEDLMEAKAALPELSFSPSQESMNMILAYSQL